MTDATVLLVAAGATRCAIDLAEVREVVRPLPLIPLPAAPPALLGAAVLRGAPTPVLSLAALLGRQAAEARRWIALAADGRIAALAVEEVLGVRRVRRDELLRWTSPDPVAAGLGGWDGGLTIAVRAVRALDAYAEVAP